MAPLEEIRFLKKNRAEKQTNKPLNISKNTNDWEIHIFNFKEIRHPLNAHTPSSFGWQTSYCLGTGWCQCQLQLSVECILTNLVLFKNSSFIIHVGAWVGACLNHSVCVRSSQKTTLCRRFFPTVTFMWALAIKIRECTFHSKAPLLTKPYG